MSYGSPEWQPWVLKEDEGSSHPFNFGSASIDLTHFRVHIAQEHIKVAYDMGINAFDTAGVYSAGLSEIILGKAIKKWNLPRDEIVIMTKVFFAVGREPGADPGDMSSEERNLNRFVNQSGLSRKVCALLEWDDRR